MVVAITSFSAMALLQAGLANSELGILLTVASLATVGLQFGLGRMADRGHSLIILQLLLWVTIFLMFTSVFLFIQNSYLTIGVHFLINVGVPSMIPLMSALAMTLTNQGKMVDFGVARGIGSLTFAIVSAGLGRLITTWGTSVLQVSLLVFLLLMFLTLLRLVRLLQLPRHPRLPRHPLGEGSEQVSEEGVRSSSVDFDRQRFAFLIFGLILLLIGHTMPGVYLFQLVVSLGGGSTEFGIVQSLTALFEIPAMFGFAWIAGRIFSGRLLRLASVGFALKSVLLVPISSIAGLYGLSALQLVGYGLFIPASVYYVNRVVPNDFRVRGQAIMSSTWTIGSMISTLAGGFLIDRLGMEGMLVTSAVLSVLGMIIAIPAAVPSVPAVSGGSGVSEV